MRALTPLEIVQVWEAGLGMHAIDRALAMLQPVLPELDDTALASLSLGVRDAHLFELRERTFGDAMPSLARCPSCGVEIEFVTSAAALRMPAAAPPSFTVEHDGATLELRLPDSRDLAAAAQASDPEAAAQLLVERCLVRGDAVGATAREAVARALVAADPQLEMLIDVSCPECAHAWQSTLDIGEFLWGEIAAEARRLLQQVHVLASAYGWSEEAVLRLGPARRRFYLQMAHG